MKKFLTILCLSAQLIVSLVGSEVFAQDNKVIAPDTFPKIEKLLKENKFEVALIAANKATQENPKSGMAFFLLGRTQFYREQDAAAQNAFDKSIELTPAFSEAWFFRGLTYVFGKQEDKARSDFEKAVQLNPQESKYWFELGKLNERAGEKDAAIAAFQKAVELDPSLASAWFSIGTLASEKGDTDKAAEMWDKSLKIDSNKVEAHWNLGIHHQLRGDPKISLSHFLAVLKHSPQDVEAVKKIIQAYYRLEDYENAQKYRAKFLNLIAKSKDPEIRGLNEFCFDQFESSGGRFFVYETIEKKGGLIYWFKFKLVDSEGKVIKSINLETSDYMKEQGFGFLLGQTVGSAHQTFGVGFKKLPHYPELKKLVIEANLGKLKVVASSAPSEK